MKRNIILITLTYISMITNAQIPTMNVCIKSNAPVVQKRQIEINAPQEEVWKVLTTIEKWPNWHKDISKAHLQNELEQEADFVWYINGSKIKSNVHTLKTDTALGWTGKAFGAKAIHNWYLEPTAQGTIVHVEESLDGWLVSLLKKKINKDLKEGMQYWLDQLKVTCEK